MKCIKCGAKGKEREVKHNGLTHLEVYCPKCDRHITFKKQPINKFIMPFGKYKGFNLQHISAENSDYLFWAVENLKGNVRYRIEEFLSIK